MENTSFHFKCEVDNLYFTTIEEAISSYFDMGFPYSSGLPSEMKENSSGRYVLACLEKSGEFRVSNYKLKNGKHMLSVSLNEKLHK